MLRGYFMTNCWELLKMFEQESDYVKIPRMTVVTATWRYIEKGGN